MTPGLNDWAKDHQCVSSESELFAARIELEDIATDLDAATEGTPPDPYLDVMRGVAAIEVGNADEFVNAMAAVQDVRPR